MQLTTIFNQDSQQVSQPTSEERTKKENTHKEDNTTKKDRKITYTIDDLIQTLEEASNHLETSCSLIFN